MTTEAAAPAAPEAPASTETPEQIAATAALTAKNREIDADPEANTEEPKAQKTPEERRIAQLQRAVDRKTRQLAEYRAREALTREAPAQNNRAADDSEPVSLTKAEFDARVRAEAEKLAPTLTEQANEVKRRQEVVAGLAKTWGKERFDELSSDLDDALGGLADAKGRPKPATEAVFEADEPARVIEWLADPENLEEAERIARLGPVQAGRAIAKLEAQLKADTKGKPRPSKAPAPLEPVKGQGAGKEKRLAELTGDDFAKRRREQIAQRRGF